MTEYPFEIPQAMREQAERNTKLARELTDFVTKAMDAWIGAMPSPMATGIKDVRERAMDFAKENADSVFTFAGKVCNAKTSQEILTLQTQFAQDRMQAFVTQTQQLFSVIEETIQKWARGAMGTEMSALPSNLMTAGFKDVQDRAVEIAKKNAESGSA
jgi:hypothetical protein